MTFATCYDAVAVIELPALLFGPLLIYNMVVISYEMIRFDHGDHGSLTSNDSFRNIFFGTWSSVSVSSNLRWLDKLPPVSFWILFIYV